MELFHRALKVAVDGNASDIHIKVNAPVILRINRELVALESPHPTLEWMNQVVDTITPKHLKKRLEEEREVDFSSRRMSATRSAASWPKPCVAWSASGWCPRSMGKCCRPWKS